MSDYIKTQTTDDFYKARGKAILSRIQHFMNVDRDKLLSFNDVKDILKPKNQSYLGMRAIPINLIVGSEGRYRDFNKYFLPNSDHLRYRWERVDAAHHQSIILPPIQLYEIGGVYFVRDGNHRVSVAKAQGIESIDAEVTSLSSDIAINPKMTTDDLRKAVIDNEKESFYEKTSFGELTGCKTLDFTSTGRYDIIYQHILAHKYYLNQNMTGEIPFADAMVSWYNNVYDPIIQIINEERLCQNFPKRTPSDLYVWIVKHWDTLKGEIGTDYPVADAALDFSKKYGKAGGWLVRAGDFLRRFFGRGRGNP